jgi:hypothetical protein
MQAGAKRQYDKGDIRVISNDTDDSDQVSSILCNEAASHLLAVSSRRAKNVANFEKTAKRRLAEKLAALAELQQRRDSRIVQVTAMASRLEEKWRRLYLQRERNAEQHRRDAIRNKLAFRRYQSLGVFHCFSFLRTFGGSILSFNLQLLTLMQRKRAP